MVGLAIGPLSFWDFLGFQRQKLHPLASSACFSESLLQKDGETPLSTRTAQEGRHGLGQRRQIRGKNGTNPGEALEKPWKT